MYYELTVIPVMTQSIIYFKDKPNVAKSMKERFAFKVKIGEENLDKFITEGLTASGQNEFFLQHSIKYAQVCRTQQFIREWMKQYRYTEPNMNNRTQEFGSFKLSDQVVISSGSDDFSYRKEIFIGICSLLLG